VPRTVYVVQRAAVAAAAPAALPHAGSAPGLAPRLVVGGSRPRALLIAAVPGWSFERHARTLAARLGDEFDCTVAFLGERYDEDAYDLIYPLEFPLAPTSWIRTPSKYVTAIRSHVSWAQYGAGPLSQYLAAHFAQVHVVSRRLHALFAPHLPDVRYVSHGIDTRHFTPTTRADRSGPRLRLGWAGNRQTAAKGFEEFVAPLGRLPGVELVFCGYSDRNLTLGEMRGFYDSLDAYVCTSATEGNNNSLMEAAAMARAIVTTDAGTVPEYLAHGASALVVPREAGRFAEAVAALRVDPALRRTLGAAARAAAVTRWDWRARAEDYRAMFREVVEGVAIG
jgi:glycosyltransferase involved in cell wall biosynthesis